MSMIKQPNLDSKTTCRRKHRVINIGQSHVYKICNDYLGLEFIPLKFSYVNNTQITTFIPFVKAIVILNLSSNA